MIPCQYYLDLDVAPSTSSEPSRTHRLSGVLDRMDLLSANTSTSATPPATLALASVEREPTCLTITHPTAPLLGHKVEFTDGTTKGRRLPDAVTC